MCLINSNHRRIGKESVGACTDKQQLRKPSAPARFRGFTPMRGSVLILVFGVSLSGLAAEHASPRFKIDPSPPPRDTQPGLSFAPVAEKVGPSVVNVYSTRAAREPVSEMPFMQDPLFRRFFGGRSPSEMPQ